ncbi:AraC-like transcriptional regulator QhpR [Pseudomonas schmalbachii]|uniref:AraC family transcriptional regulator n=1 Tax=Pseudomonas schmalbachii TaxID=2816993 RepID=A0ABS3TTC6_9PSED|nr:AraC family transcriptional regulator [Pseudomonas schmalbachii]MBO3276932.1 AraC family transcriptional regulator [Pseudomonas schmalbachii]
MSVPTFTFFTETFFKHHREIFQPHLAAIGLGEEALDDPDLEIPNANFVELLEVISRAGDPSIGLRVALAESEVGLFGSFGVFGAAVRCAGDVRAMLECLSNYFVVCCQGVEISWQIEGQQVSLHYQTIDPTVIQRRQDSELAIARFHCLIRQLTGKTVTPHSVEFEHPRPDDISLHKELFGCPLSFDCATNRIVWPVEILDLPLVSADPRLFRTLLTALEEQRKKRLASSDLPSRIAQAIVANLPSGRIGQDQIAQSLCMSTRTLQRRLQMLQMDFNELVEEIRRHQALDYVANSDRNITEIAALLGYNETSSFSRAFRRWTETSPKQYRQQTQRRLVG